MIPGKLNPVHDALMQAVKSLPNPGDTITVKLTRLRIQAPPNSKSLPFLTTRAPGIDH